SYIIALNEIETNVSHRAARYYRFDPKIYKKTQNKLIK
ncbi:MAG: DNA mismatch repair protein MutT, partial [Chryseobacterium sp.]